VVAEFLRKILGLRANSCPEIQPALEELDRLGQERPSIAEPAALLGRILSVLYQNPCQDTSPLIPQERVEAKLAGGIPIWRGEQVTIDSKALLSRWQRLCDVIRRQPGENGSAAQDLEASVRHGRLDPEELMRELLAGRPQQVHDRAAVLSLDAGLTATVLRFTVMPALTQIRLALGPLPADTVWKSGLCPYCGSWPLLGEHRGLEQSRVLRCGFCTAEWQFPRLECPSCTTRDHNLLGYFSVEGEEAKYRASTCDSCHRYVKMVSTLAALDGPGLAVADLATLHLDLAAAERGYVN
jgi:FdhE protein